jgi:hypothetical protein
MLIAPPRHLAALAALGAALAVPPAYAQTVHFAGRTLQTNIGQGSGAVVLDGTSLRMMDGEYEAARSALSTSQFNLFGAWSTTYTMRFSCVGVSDECPGDGIAFVAAAGEATQVGEGGLLQGYQGGPPAHSARASPSASIRSETGPYSGGTARSSLISRTPSLSGTRGSSIRSPSR